MELKIVLKIKFNTEDDIPLNKELYLPTITVIIRYIFKNDHKYYYTQIFLDGCKYKNVAV